MRIVSYVRTSKGEKASDPTRQVMRITEWVQAGGHLWVERYQDIGGKRSEASNPKKRPDFHRMLADMTGDPRPFDAIVVEEASRFGTADEYEFKHFLYLLRKAGIALIEARDNRLLNPDPEQMGEVLTATIGAMSSTQELRDKSSRTIGGHMKKAAQGLWQGGPIASCSAVRCAGQGGQEQWCVEARGDKFVQWFPDGRVVVRDTFPGHNRSEELRLVPSRDEGEREAVRRLFTAYDQGVGTPTIARMLNAEFPRPHGRWYATLVKGLLRMPHFAGRSRYGRIRRGKYHRRTEGTSYEKVQDPGTYEYVGYQNWLIGPETEDGVIPWDLFERVQARLDARGSKKPRLLRNLEGWLSGVIVCGHCSARMSVWPLKNQPLRMGCSTYRKMGKEVCSANSVKHEVLVGIVDRYLADTGRTLAGLDGQSLAPLFSKEREVRGYLGEIRLTIESYLYDRLAAHLPYEQNEGGYRIFQVDVAGEIRRLQLPDFSGDHETIEEVLDQVEDLDACGARAELGRARAEHDRLFGLFKADLPEMLRGKLLAEIEGQERAIASLGASLGGLGQQLREAIGELSELSGRVEAARALLASEEAEKRAEAVRAIIDRVVLEFEEVYSGPQLQHRLKSATVIPHLGDEVVYEGSSLSSEATSARRSSGQDIRQSLMSTLVRVYSFVA